MALEHPFIENIPAYALGALDADESVALKSHLETCAICQAELAAYRTVSNNLLLALPPRTPSAALRRRLESRLPGAQKESKPRWQWSFSQPALTLAIVLLVVLNLFSFLQIQMLQRQQAELVRQTETGQAALAMLTYSGTQTLPINAENITGNLLLDKDRNIAVLIIWNLPPPENNQTYQIWLIDPQGQRTSAGLFRPQADQPFTSASIFSLSNLSNYIGIGVTLEPAGGSDHPTGPRIFKVDF